MGSSNQRDKAIELMRMVGGHGVGLSSTEFVPLLQLLQKQPQVGQSDDAVGG